MEKEKKLESHFERKNRDKECEKSGVIKCHRFAERQSVVNNVVVKDVVDEAYYPNDNFKNFRCSDFLMENIDAAGAYDMLKPCPSIGQPDVDTTVESMTKQFDDIINKSNQN